MDIDISVIVPVYNVADYLEECVNSLVDQTKDNIEIILVDDGSTDSSKEICNKVAQRYDNIKVIHKVNGGLSSARNAGIDIANGRYLAFVDSDDWVHKDMLKVMFELATKNDADIVQCDFLRVNSIEQINNIDDNSDYKILSNIESLCELHEETYVNTILAWNKIYRKELFDEIRYPNGKIHEDELTTYKLIYKANKIIKTNRVLYYYRYNTNSITTANFSEKKLSALEALEERINFMKKINNKELVCKAIQRYANLIAEYYYLAKTSNSIDDNICNDILLKGKKIRKDFYRDLRYGIKNKIKFIIFSINPSLYLFFRKMCN